MPEEEEIEETPREEAAETPEDEPAPEEEEEPEKDEPPRGPMDFDDLIDPANGLIHGKFKDPIAAARAYKGAEKQMGKATQEAADLRKALADAGYTFGADGKPVAPAPKEADAEGGGQNRVAPNVERPLDEEVARDADGVPLNFLGLPIVSDDEWEDLKASDERAYARVLHQYERRQADLLAQFREGGKSARAAALEAEKARVRQVAADKWELPESFMDEVEAKVKAEVLPTLHPSLQGDPQAYRFAMQLQAAEMMPAFFKKQMEIALSGNAEAAARAQKVIRSERGAPAEAEGQKAAGAKLTADEARMAKELGITHESYIRNRNRESA
jgi:hypothetical protein